MTMQCSSMNQDVLTLSLYPHAAPTHPATEPLVAVQNTALFEDMAGRWSVEVELVYGPRIYMRPRAAGGRAPAASLIALFRRGGSSSILLEKVLLPVLGLRLELLLLLGLLLLLRRLVRRRRVKEAEDGVLRHLGDRAQ